MTSVPCPTCLHPIKLTYHQRRSMARGHQPRCPICNPRPPKCAVCNGPHRKSEHVFGESKSACPLCAGLAHRVVGPRCKSCKMLYADEAPVELEDPMRSHMGGSGGFGRGIMIALAHNAFGMRSLPRAAHSLTGVAACRDEGAAHQFSTWRVNNSDGCDTELGLADCNETRAPERRA